MMEKKDLNIIEALQQIYPDKDYKLTEIKDNYPKLYKMIQKNSKEKNQTPSKYLNFLGFNKCNSKKKSQSDDNFFYDVATMYKLCNEYQVNQTDLAIFMGCSRNNISLKMKKSSFFDKDKWIIPLSEDEIENICKFLYSEKDEGVSGTFSFKLIRGKDNIYKKAIILRNKNIMKVSFDFPSKIKVALKDSRLNEYSSDELDDLKKINQIWKGQGSVIQDNKKIVRLSSSDKSPFNKWLKKKGLGINEYLMQAGYTLEDGRTMSNEDILSKIEKYSDSNHNIVLHSDDDDYTIFASRASRQGQSIYDFFKAHGYTYKRGHYVGNTFEKHKKIIIERYLVHDNFIYISSYDQYYGTLVSFARLKGKKLDQIIEEMGFVRIKDIRDLPEGYCLYDYNVLASTGHQFEDDNIAMALSLISNDLNEIYLDVSSYFYYILFLKAKTEEISITDLISRYGYKRVFEPFMGVDVEDAYQDIELDLEDNRRDYINKKLDELKNLESQYQMEIVQGKRISRNSKLVATLKELYQGKCQLCDSEYPIPPICKENDELYSEVHHINSLHNAISDDDIEYIDSYKNTIVLCPYHHKFVHYHHGGFKRVIEDKGILYMENSHGERIKIYTNYHLIVPELVNE